VLAQLGLDRWRPYAASPEGSGRARAARRFIWAWPPPAEPDKVTSVAQKRQLQKNRHGWSLMRWGRHLPLGPPAWAHPDGPDAGAKPSIHTPSHIPALLLPQHLEGKAVVGDGDPATL
jgi:hypothetical protein